MVLHAAGKPVFEWDDGPSWYLVNQSLLGLWVSVTCPTKLHLYWRTAAKPSPKVHTRLYLVVQQVSLPPQNSRALVGCQVHVCLCSLWLFVGFIHVLAGFPETCQQVVWPLGVNLCVWCTHLFIGGQAGHPKTWAFATDGGLNSVYQVIYRGVPISISIQLDNVVHMQAKGVTIILDFSSTQTQDLVDALTAVICSTTVRDRLFLRLSRLDRTRYVQFH